jgi:hypothetical protein
MINSKTFRVVNGTVSILSLIVSFVQVVEFGMDYYKKKIQKPQKVAEVSSATSI